MRGVERRVDRHDRHDEVVRTLRGWFLEGHPGSGYDVEDRPYGVCQVYPNGDWGVHVRPGADVDVAGMLDDARSRCSGVVRVMTDDRETDARHSAALQAAGLAADAGNVHLAFVGDPPSVPEVRGLAVRETDDVAAFSRLKLQAFGDTHDEPAPDAVANEVSFRMADAKVDGRFVVASLDGVPAAIRAVYDAPEGVAVFLLGTLPRFRRRGVATHLLAAAVAGAGERWTVINCDVGGVPESIYRAMGFTDEVWWRRRYAPPS